MLVKFFQYGAVKKGQKGHSGGGGAVKNYLLGKNFDKGEIREGATLFRGDPNETTSIINGIGRQSYYKSGVLSFTNSDSRKLDNDQLNEIIDSFEATMFANLDPDQYSGYWVKHTDKDRTELHFVYAEEELKSGYALPVYYAKVDKPLVDSWKDLTNDKYNLDDPNAPDHKRERIVTKGFELKKGYEPKNGKLSDEQLKDEIHKHIFAYAEFMPNINNRDDIINAFKTLDYKVVSKPTDKYISIEHPNKKDNPKLKNLRFKDGIYSKDFDRSMLSKNKSYEQLEYERKRPERISKAQKIYDSSLQKRIERINHRYRNVEHKPLDNQLTHDLKQIQATNEPDFKKQIAEYQRQELKKIIGQSIEQIYKQHEHDSPEQLVSLKELHKILIDDIDNQLKDEPLPQFAQIIEQYTNAKDHVVTVDTIEHDRHQAQLAKQQAEQEFKVSIQSQLDYMLSNVGEVLPQTNYIKWQSLSDSDLAAYLTDYQQQGQALLDKAHNQILDPQELQNDKLIKDVITTINDITANRERDRLEQLRAEQAKIKFDNQIKAQLDALASITGQVTKSLYNSLRTYEPSELDQIKVTHTNLTERLFETAVHEIISDFDNDVDKFTTSKNILATIEYINQKREHQARLDEQQRLAEERAKALAERSKPVVKPSAPTEPLEKTKPPIERKSIADDRNARLAQAQKIIAGFDKLVKGNAEKLKTATVKDRTDKFNEASKALTDSGKKPLFMGKEQWEVDNKKLTLKKRNAEISLDQAKGDTEKLKQWNFELELFREKELQPINYTAIALEHLDKTTKDKVQQAHDVIDQINDEINREKAQSLGAERLAKTGEYYTGKVIKVNQHGAYQQTKQGVVLHPAYANQPNEFKAEQSYDLNYRTQGKVQKSETYEIRISGNSKDVTIDSNQER